MGTSGLGCRESEAEAPDLAEVALGRRNLQATSWAGTFLIVLALLKNRPRLHRRPPPQFEAFEFANVLWVGDFGRLGTSTEARTA